VSFSSFAFGESVEPEDSSTCLKVTPISASQHRIDLLVKWRGFFVTPCPVAVMVFGYLVPVLKVLHLPLTLAACHFSDLGNFLHNFLLHLPGIP